MRFEVGALLSFSLAVCAGGFSWSCAASDRDSQAVSRVRSEISGGQLDSVDSNVFLLTSQRGATGIALCSASLIAPNLLLTARHCVSAVTEGEVSCGKTMVAAPFPVTSFLAANEQSADDVRSAYRALTVSVPSEGGDICGYDLALITLTTNVPESAATPLVPRIDRAVARAERYSAVGYGLDGAGDQAVAGLRRARAGLAVSCIPGKCGTGIEATEFVGEGGVCSGDSGGPALDEAGKVVGVASRAGTDCAHPVYSSLASWKDWLSQVAGQAAEQGNYAAPFWVNTGLSDPPAESAGAAGTSSAWGAAAGAGELGKQGDQCAGPEECSSAFACYSPSGSTHDGYCAGFCSGPSDCPSGTSCSAGLGVCVETRSESLNASCALRGAGAGPRGRAPWPTLALSLGVLILCQRKRRRASFPKRV
ncbi:MAG TPA: trypsin-like serine protease [Polyangiaceae bacterium]|jgi:hypothetical protein